jgi:DNA-binding GntR family transcriptional regulator
MTLLKRIDLPPSLKEMAYQSIKNAILVNKLEAGKLYNERQLADELGISKTPVREALMDLAGQGFVIPHPRRGFQIRVLTEKNIRDIYQFRRALETAVVRLIVNKLTDDDFKRIQKLHETEQDAIKAFDRAAYMRIDRQFHLLLVHLTENDYMITSLENVRDLVDWSGIVTLSRRERMHEINLEHKRVIDALLNGNGSKAEQLMEEHLIKSEEAVAQFYK